MAPRTMRSLHQRATAGDARAPSKISSKCVAEDVTATPDFEVAGAGSTKSNLHQRATPGDSRGQPQAKTSSRRVTKSVPATHGSEVAGRTASNLHRERATAGGDARGQPKTPSRRVAAGGDARVQPKTSSRCVTESVTATHDFEVAGYSELKALGVGQFVSSRSFTAGGHDWTIRFYPKQKQQRGELIDFSPPLFYAGACLHLCDAGEGTELTVRFTLALLQRDGRASPMASRTMTAVFGAQPRQRHGFHRLVDGSKLGPWRCLRNDALTIRCALTVVRTADPVAPPELAAHLGRVLGSGVGADVTFQVGGRAFPAHRVMLAARSPVFSAELFGGMMEKDARCVEIADMRPEVFELLLQFVYTDALPRDGEGCDAATMQHLLVAADRYGLDRLKHMCEGKLHASVDAETAASMLALAERHSCPRLKDVCVACMASGSPKSQASST